MKLFDKVALAKIEIEALLNEDPSYKLWASIRNQLEFISKDISSEDIIKKTYAIDEVKKIIMGVQAVREIENGNPKLSDLLCDIDFEYKEKYGISLLP